MTEHEAILNLKDITQVFQAEDREEVDNMFYNQLTLDDIRENLQDFNCVIGEIKQILREVEDGNDKTADLAKRVAIDTMLKYQKIEEIMHELNGDFYGSYLKDRQALEKIYEVLEK